MSNLVEKVDEAIKYVEKADESKADDDAKEPKLLSAVGYDKQTFIKLVTKIDDKKTNQSQIPKLGLGVCSSTYPIIHHQYTSNTQINSTTNNANNAMYIKQYIYIHHIIICYMK